MEKGNVLVIGNSGVGKSTLINAVLGERAAKTGWGTHGTTNKLDIYEPKDADVPFRVIDTIGFEPNYFKERQAVNAVKKWSKKCAKKGNENSKIDVIWFCVEGTSSKIFPQTIKNLTRAAAMWESVPVIVVITKSYSVPERQKNIDMVHNAFASQKKHGSNLRGVIPVVAEKYKIDEDMTVPASGISELVSTTNELMPEGMRESEKAIKKFILDRKRTMAHAAVVMSTTVGIGIGAAPIPFSDAILLATTEGVEVNAIAMIYEIGKDDGSKQFLNSIVEVGTVSAVAKTLISVLKAIPGINLAASVLNAVIAGSIVAALGEGCIYAFEQVYLGNKTVSDIDWVKKVIESKLSLTVVEKAKTILEKLSETSDSKEILSAVLELVTSAFGNNNAARDI